ncbi:MAG: TRAP transporter substrate-binding protein [Succinivibrio sp.]|nr:TRAP transporter substrate-binding protein [Succinivibrio sp.]
MKLSLKLMSSALLTATVLSFASPSQAKTHRIIFANYFGPTHPNTLMMQKFKEDIEKKSNGAFKVTLKPNNEAGGEEKLVELIKRGTIQIAIVGGYIKNDEPSTANIEQPFIIDGWDHAKRVYTGNEEIHKALDGQYYEKTGVKIAGYVVNGFRQISSSKPITQLSDFGTVKLRTPLNDVFVETFKALGTNPTPLPMTELYTGLETGVVDGQDNPWATVKEMGWWEVQKYLLNSNHMFSPSFVLVNDKNFYSTLTADEKKIFDECMKDAIAYDWDISEKADAEALKFLTDKGLKLTVPDEKFKADMRKACEPVYEWFDKNFPNSKEFREFVLSKK